MIFYQKYSKMLNETEFDKSRVSQNIELFASKLLTRETKTKFYIVYVFPLRRILERVGHQQKNDELKLLAFERKILKKYMVLC